jgi:hypothetical protein
MKTPMLRYNLLRHRREEKRSESQQYTLRKTKMKDLKIKTIYSTGSRHSFSNSPCKRKFEVMILTPTIIL